MKLSDRFLEYAVLNIYAHHCVRSGVGGCLDLASLREEWTVNYHLRQDDLLQALRRLVADGYLIETEVETGAAYLLTEQGLEYSRGGPNLMTRIRSFFYMTRLSGFHARHVSGNSGERRRRSDATSTSTS